MFSWWFDNEPLVEQIMVYALLAFSIQVAMRAGTFSLASVGFYGIGSYTAAILVANHGVPAPLAIAIAVAACGVIGYILALLLVRLKDLYLGMATVAFDLMVGVVVLNWTGVTGGPVGMYGIPVSVTSVGMLIIVLVVVVLLTLLQVGTIGRTFEAAREDEQLALVAGINTRRYRRFAFTLSAMLGALAGTMHSLTFNTINPDDANFSLIILALAMVVIGGFGSWFGALIGAFVLAYLPTNLTSLGDVWPVIYGGTMLLVAVYLPGGLYGLGRRGVLWAKDAVTRSRAPRAEPAGSIA